MYRNMPKGPIPSVVVWNAISPIWYRWHANVRGQAMPVLALATALANASPEQQRMMLGEDLFMNESL